MEYDDHAMRRWIYIDQRTHCQHCGIEFTEVGMVRIIDPNNTLQKEKKIITNHNNHRENSGSRVLNEGLNSLTFQPL